MRNIEKQKGITLIALVITIIVLLILSSVSIAMLIGESGVLTKAETASDETRRKGAIEKVKLAVQESIGQSGKIDVEKLEENLQQIEGFEKSYNIPGYQVSRIIKVENTEIYISENGKTKIKDENTFAKEKLKKGDCVSYTAGIWTQEEIDEITKNGYYGGEANPTSFYKFGGFKSGDSKDKTSPYAVGDDEKKTIDEKWSVIKNEKGKVWLIHNGCPEVYYQGNETNAAYKAYYIFTGKKHGEDSSTITNGITKRDWKYYEDGYLAKNDSATIPDTGLVNHNGYYFFLANAWSNNSLAYYYPANAWTATSNKICGIRPVLCLKEEVKVIDGSGEPESPYILTL